MSARYSVGIDLGTTHCVLSYVDLQAGDEQVELTVLPIPQLTGPGTIEEKSQLASFTYLAHAAEIAEGSTSLPWTAKPDYLVGEVARNLGSKTPIRLVASAKSWLCHAGVDCKQAILPAEAPEDVERISPFVATKAYLQHLRDAWNHRFAENRLEYQDLTITVPASFDPAARELTVDAARSVGLGQAVLLEEPQAALYSWIENSEGDWRNHVKIGDVILVIDVGGGTTDLSLIAVTEQDGNLQLTRVAVGDHILLGGDNMDLALAYTVKAKLEQESGKKLESWQLQSLTHACREAKEKLFNQSELGSMPLVVASRGSSLIGGTLRTELTRDELNRVLVDGFLPYAQAGDRPVVRPRSGLRSAGLPYAQDAGITRHLAAFLSRQRQATDEFQAINLPEHASFLHPTAVLFNGGVLKAGVLAERLMNILNNWLQAEQAPAARLLQGADLDLAVARGAAYYGFVRQGKGVFYACDQSNPENEEKLRHDGDDFLVYSHYNMLISYLNDKGEIYLERYEPANTHYQGNLNQLMEKLFVSTFGKYTKRDIKFNLISEKGLQNRYKDRTLCGHHILYWLIYRLKYGKDKAIEILNNPDTVSSSSFKKFCLCMTDSRVIKCSEGVA